MDGLLSIAISKAEEVQFAAGEALCYVFGGACEPAPGCCALYA